MSLTTYTLRVSYLSLAVTLGLSAAFTADDIRPIAPLLTAPVSALLVAPELGGQVFATIVGTYSGTLINPRTVMTAARCVCDGLSVCVTCATFRPWTVRVGPTGVAQGNFDVASDVFVHPKSERLQFSQNALQLSGSGGRPTNLRRELPVLPYVVSGIAQGDTLARIGSIKSECQTSSDSNRMQNESVTEYLYPSIIDPSTVSKGPSPTLSAATAYHLSTTPSYLLLGRVS